MAQTWKSAVTAVFKQETEGGDTRRAKAYILGLLHYYAQWGAFGADECKFLHALDTFDTERYAMNNLGLLNGVRIRTPEEVEMTI